MDYNLAVPSRTIWRDRFGPPTLERSGSEHRRAVTSPPSEEGLGVDVEFPLRVREDGCVFEKKHFDHIKPEVYLNFTLMVISMRR